MLCRHLIVVASLVARAGKMRPSTALLIIGNLLFCITANGAQLNYELFPGYGSKLGYPVVVSYRAWVISYKANKYYACVASYEAATPKTPKLNCTLGGSFEPPLLSGPDVKTVQALGGPRSGRETAEALSSFLWQIDQNNGKVQFCMPLEKANCATFQIPE